MSNPLKPGLYKLATPIKNPEYIPRSRLWSERKQIAAGTYEVVKYSAGGLAIRLYMDTALRISNAHEGGVLYKALAPSLVPQDDEYEVRVMENGVCIDTSKVSRSVAEQIQALLQKAK